MQQGGDDDDEGWASDTADPSVPEVGEAGPSGHRSTSSERGRRSKSPKAKFQALRAHRPAPAVPHHRPPRRQSIRRGILGRAARQALQPPVHADDGGTAIAETDDEDNGEHSDSSSAGDLSIPGTPPRAHNMHSRSASVSSVNSERKGRPQQLRLLSASSTRPSSPARSIRFADEPSSPRPDLTSRPSSIFSPTSPTESLGDKGRVTFDENSAKRRRSGGN